MSTGFMDTFPFILPKGDLKERFYKTSESMILVSNQINEYKENFIKLILSKFEIEKLSKKLQNWDEIEFADFLKDINTNTSGRSTNYNLVNGKDLKGMVIRVKLTNNDDDEAYISVVSVIYQPIELS